MKKIITSSAIITLCASGFALADASFGEYIYSKNESSAKMEIHMMMPKNHNDLQKAIEAKDFAAFQTAAKDSPMSVIDTQAEFDQIVAMHGKMQATKVEMEALHSSLGIAKAKITTPTKGQKMEMQKNHEAIKKAVEANNFAAFQTAVKDSPMAVVDTQAEFDQVVVMHAKMQIAKTEMEALHTSLGIAKPEMKNMKKEGEIQNTDMKKSKMKTPKLNLKKSVQKDLKLSIVAGTYEEFIANLPTEHVLSTKITKDNFAQLKLLVDAKKAGDTTKVKEILTSLQLTNKEKSLIKKIVK